MGVYKKRKCRFCTTKKDVRGITNHEKACEKEYHARIEERRLSERDDIDGVLYFDGEDCLVDAQVSIGEKDWPEDPIRHPPHYQAGGIEAIDVIVAFAPDDTFRGNALKYLMRAGRKGSMIEDLEKAEVYLQWAIDRAYGRALRKYPQALGQVSED